MRDIKELAEAQSPFDPEIERKGGTPESSKSARKRGTWLTIWLVFLILANAVGAIRSILVILSITTVPFSLPLWANYESIASPVLIAVSLIAMLMWKKWGFYMFCVLVVLGFVLGFAVNLTLTLGVGIVSFIGLPIGLLEILITYLLIRSSWSLFD